MSPHEWPVVPGAEPYSADGGPIGVLLIHGFTGSPASMTPWAKFLEKRGHTVRVVRLPGHGTDWRDLKTKRWDDWYGAAEAAFDELNAVSDHVAVCALSMGGAVALRLAETHRFDSLVLVNPYLIPKPLERLGTPIARWLLPSFPGIGNDIKKPGGDEVGYDKVPLHAVASLLKGQRLVRSELSKVHVPTLLFRATEDHVVSHKGRDLIMKQLGNGVEYVELADSYHVATLDNDAELIFEKSAEFIERHAAADA